MLSIGVLSRLGLGQPDDFCTRRALPASRQSVVERAVSLRGAFAAAAVGCSGVTGGWSGGVQDLIAVENDPKAHTIVMRPALLLAEKWRV